MAKQQKDREIEDTEAPVEYRQKFTTKTVGKSDRGRKEGSRVYPGYEDESIAGRAQIKAFNEAGGSKYIYPGSSKEKYVEAANKALDARERAVKGAKAFKAQLNKEMDKNKLPTFKKGGSVGSASKRADGLAKKGKTKGRFV